MSWLVFAILLISNLAGWHLLRRREQALFDEIRASASATPLAEELIKTARTAGHEAFVFRRPESLDSVEIEVLTKLGDSWVPWRTIPADQALPLLLAFETLRAAQYHGVNHQGDPLNFDFTDFQDFDTDHLPIEIRLTSTAPAGGTPAIQ